MNTSANKRVRCAIYTRKSTEEGLDQDFNSLAAQRTACEAYVLSQAGEGWRLVKTPYDDGGFSGGTMERPAIKALLAAVDAGEIDVIVVYKVDRLTRSLMDFARIVERLDATGASFVSVTQAFNTTNSMGRLTLNVLLSFAQFEREITGERIRDKIAMSKKRGMWMGGRAPLGYHGERGLLSIIPEEAETVRSIFDRYLSLGSVRAVADELIAKGVTSKKVTTKAGRELGGNALWIGPVRYILTNRTYLGEIRHGPIWHQGQHEAIVDNETFDRAQERLAVGAAPRRRTKKIEQRPLLGIAFDDAGFPLTPSHTVTRRGRRYDYYISNALLRPGNLHPGSLARISAAALESQVMEICARVLSLPPDWTVIRTSLRRLTLSKESIIIEADFSDAEKALPQSRLRLGESLEAGDGRAVLRMPTKAKPWRGRARTFTPRGTLKGVGEGDISLLTAIALAHLWRAQWASGEASVTEIASREGVDRSHVFRLVRLAYLAPDLTRAILDGAQPHWMTVTALMAAELPADWISQRRLFGVAHR